MRGAVLAAATVLALLCAGCARDPESVEPIRIVSLSDANTQPLVDVARRTGKLARHVTGLPIPGRTLTVYLCRTPAEAHAAARSYGVAPPRTGGTFYKSGPVAILLDHSAHTVSHEFMHWIVSNWIPDCPDFLNEGLANLIAERIAGTGVKRVAPSRRGRAARLRAYLKRDDRRSFAALVGGELHGFQASAKDQRLYYDLAWCFARVLEERGELKKLLARMRASSKRPLEVLEAALRDGEIEKAWQVRLRTVADG